METDEIVAAISAAWELDGFLGRLRDLQFDESAGREFVGLLESLPSEGAELIHKDLVRILWYVLPFINNQLTRLETRDPDGSAIFQLGQLATRTENELFRVFGVP